MWHALGIYISIEIFIAQRAIIATVQVWIIDGKEGKNSSMWPNDKAQNSALRKHLIQEFANYWLVKHDNHFPLCFSRWVTA